MRALDESYVQARAGYRPTASLQIEPSFSKIQQTDLFGQRIDPSTNTGAATLSINQPLYTSGATTLGVEAAADDIRSQREALRATEATVLQNVVQAYVDVRRDEQILLAYENEVGILQSQLDDATARRKAGEVTRTDVEQSEAQLDTARATLSLAQGQLQVSRAEYFAVVGQNPGTLAPEPPLPGLPSTIDEAFETAEANSATLRQVEIAESGSAARIAQAKAAYRPTVELAATYGYTGDLAPFSVRNEDRAVTVGAVVTIPLLTAGVADSQVRKAIEQNNSDRINIEAARRSVLQAVSNAWNAALANRSAAESDERAVEVAREYFSDTEEEYRVGQRSTLDVLVAEQTLRNAEITLAQAEHDSYLGQAALLGAIGRLEATNLVKDIPLYDPAEAFRKVRLKGAAPWEGLIAGLDGLGAPDRTTYPLASPTVDPSPTLLEGPPLPDDAPPSTNEPTQPIAHTTSPNTPPGLGADRGAPYTDSR